MNISQSYQISAKLCGNDIAIELNNWSFLSKGQGHIILQNNNPTDFLYCKVMMICIHEVNSVPKCFEELYYQIIKSLPKISECLLKKDKLQLGSPERLLLKDFIKNKLSISKNIPEEFIANIANNLHRRGQGWQYSLEFKPKTALPENYSNSFLQKMSENYSIKIETLHSIIENRPVQQKTRWFKKNALKETKTNLNPLQIYGIGTNKEPRLIQLLKPQNNSQKIQALTINQMEFLNSQIVKQLRQSQILNDIARLQLLFVGSCANFQTKFQQIWQKIQDKEKALQKIKQNIFQSLKNKEPVSHRLSNILYHSNLQETQKYESLQDQLENMFRFLICWSWRDISLFINFSLCNENKAVKDIQFTILDYEMKESSTLLTTKQKDQNYLINYLKYLKVI